MVAADDVVPTSIGADMVLQHPRKRGGGRDFFFQRPDRLGNAENCPEQRLSVGTTKSRRSMTGPVCVDDFVVPKAPLGIPLTTLTTGTTTRNAPKLPLRYAPDIVDLDALDNLVDGPSHRLASLSLKIRNNDPSLCKENIITTGSGTTSECSTDDSYQADSSALTLSDTDEDNDLLGGGKRVSFSEVSMRVYAPMVSDSPNPTSTYPIGLDWKYTESVSLPLEEFEDNKNKWLSSLPKDQVVLLRGFRRPKRLSPIDRFHRISDLSGLSHQEIYELEQARARRLHHSILPAGPLLLQKSTIKSKNKNNAYQIVDIDSGYQCVDV